MNLERFSHYIQIISGVVLIVGIVLVVIELRQSKALAQAQLASDSWRVVIDRMIAQMGEDTPAAMAKACNNLPLTDEEKVTLASRFQLQLAAIGRDQEVSRIAGFDDTQYRLIGSQFLPIFTTETGRRWWQSQRELYYRIAPTVAPIGDSILESMPTPDCGLSALDSHGSRKD